MVTIKADRLEALIGDIFNAAGCSRGEADRIARYLVAANLAGHDSHGVVRVPRYVEMKQDGRVVADQRIELLVDTPVLAVIDGKFGFGQSVAPQAVAIGIEKCKAMGLSAVALRNSGHVGRVGDWAEMAAAADLVSIHFVNAGGSVLVAPFAGVERRFSTAPYCIGVPLPGRLPLVLDFATSVVAEGKVLVASQGGKKIPANALIGPGGALTGNGCASLDRPSANGMFSLYVDPARIDPAGFFPEEVMRYVGHVKSAAPARPGEEILVPGEPEQASRTKRLRDGVPLPDDIWSSIAATARSVGLDDRRIVEARA